MPPISSVPFGEVAGTLPGAAAGAAGRPAEVVPYDFRRPSKLSREHIRLLQIAYETFARRLTTLLTSGLRQVCQVSVREISQQNYEEYILNLEQQTVMVPLAIPQLGSNGILEFSLEVALAAIDHMLGGPGGEQQLRSLTDIETNLMRGLIDQMAGLLQYSMEQVVPLTFTTGNIEYNPQFVQAAASTDPVVVAEFDMLVGSVRSTLTLCLPLAPLVPRLVALRARDTDADLRVAAAETVRRLRDRLGDVPVDVSVRFQDVSLSPARILSLAEGDIIPLSHRVGASLDLEAGGIVYAQAVAGKSGNRLAALIVSTPQEHA